MSSSTAVIPAPGMAESLHLPGGGSNFDFEGWEEGGSDFSQTSSLSSTGGTAVDVKARRSRSEFINASHGREAGSLSPVASLRQCALTPGQQHTVKRSISPLRMRGQGKALAPKTGETQAVKRREGPQSDDEDEEEAIDDGFDTWRGLSGDDAKNNSLDEGFANLLVGNPATEMEGGDLAALLKPSDSMEEGLQALLKQAVPPK
uniref:Uncharacterized protein n=1 Tax=Hemiselmis tepida TaxID=464990 RepID=A0A7S0VYN6_9CRYP|mmetsp:Transcript_29359/g.74437  ORF Transcript_29359/g.74437 Transcript_29359/m.74437 type:complete len:204 (+) Transcript_29359:75-686(+)